MLEKIISPYDFDWREENIITPLTELCKSPSLVKQAAIDVSDIKSEPGKVKIHVIALGAGEYWGANRNGDYFPESALLKFHKTFEKFGDFHKNHKNKPNDPKFGKVERSIYNTKMHRVELVVSVDLRVYPEFESKLRSDQEIAVSMAAKLPYDICSICGHRRTKPGREFTCKHVNDELTKMYPDGRQVYALNLEPRFFDISEVWKPADRTAYVLRKVARTMNKSPDLVDIFPNIEYPLYRGGLSKEGGTPPPSKKAVYSVPKLRKFAWDKLALIKKLSELEKRIEGELTGEVSDGKVKALKKGVTSINIPDDILKAMSDLPRSNALASLADKGIILRPEEFFKMSLKNTVPQVDEVAPLIRGIFSKLLSVKNLEDYYPDRDFDFKDVPEHSKVNNIFSRFINSRSLLREPAVKRTMVIVISKKPEEKFSTDTKELEKESSFNKCLATVYGLYKVSALSYLLEKSGEDKLENNVTAISAILENYI